MSLSSSPVKIALQQAIAHHQRGRLKEAESLYRMVLKMHPGHPDAGQNLLAALFMSGRHAEMEREAQDMVAVAPRFGIAWKGMGLAQLLQGKDAVQAFSMAAKHLPDDAEAHENLGLALKRAGRLDEAAESFQRAIKFKPGSPSAHVNLGNVLKETGRHEDAASSYRRALELKPDMLEAHNNLGNILRDRGDVEQAFACYRRALELKPGMPEALNNMGRVLKDLGRFADAESCFAQALQTKPDYTEAQYNLASVVYDQCRTSEALDHCRRALALAPDNPVFRIGETVLRLPVVPASAEEAENGVSAFSSSLQALSDWMASAPSTQFDAGVLQMPFYLAYRKGNHATLLSQFGDLFAHRDAHKVSPVEGRTKIRLAIVSNHFRRHSVWDINVKGLLQHLDRSRFEVALYYLDRLEDEETALARSLADVWRDTRTTPGFGAWLKALEEDRPDAIFYPELGMDPLAYQLASRRLAPFQAAGWGHPVTSGLPTIDTYFSGELIEAPDADAHYRERLVRLPGTGSCTTPDMPVPEALPELESALAAHTGCRFLIAQTPFKLDPSDDDLFAAIASQAGDSRFILLSHPQFPQATERLLARMGEAFRRRGLQPENHLMVIPWLSQPKFQTLLDVCDVYLDCPSFSGYTTAHMAAARGLPVVTLEGTFMRQRLAAGLLHRIGVDDTVCASEEDYVGMAVRLAQQCRDPQQQNAWDDRRTRLKAAAALADNDTQVVRAFEQSIAGALGYGSSPEDAA
jgi:protein O-GlcNAc transferase